MKISLNIESVVDGGNGINYIQPHTVFCFYICPSKYEQN